MKCIWVKALEMGSARMTEDEITSFSDVTGNRSADHGFVVGTLSRHRDAMSPAGTNCPREHLAD